MRRNISVFCLLLVAGLVLAAAVAPTAPGPGPGDRAFRAKVDSFIEEEMRLYPERATAAGDHRFDDKVRDLSRRGIEARILHASRWKKKFSRIDPRKLSAHEEADREWLVAHCDGELASLEQIRVYEKAPGLYIPTSAVYQLIVRNFAPPEDRMRLTAARERAALANLEAARRNLKADTTPRIAIEVTLQQMPATVAFFRDELPAAFANVPDGPARSAFIEANRELLAAIEAYKKWLKRHLRPVATGKFAIGPDAYERMLADDDMVYLPLPRLEAIGEGELARLQQKFRATAARIDPNRTPEEIFHELSKNHPKAEGVIPQVAAGLEELRAFVLAHHLATIPSEVRPIVKETPPYMRATTFASMDTPGPFEKSTEAYFYVTLPDPSWSDAKKEQLLSFFSPPLVSDTSVHEVYPGHYVQFLNNRLNPDKVRALYDSGANAEGWALYCEEMMLDLGLHRDDPRYRLAQIQMALHRACRYLVGIRMHTRGMTVDEAAAFFEKNAYLTPYNARVEALRGTEDPGYLRYQLGKLMILKLREDVRKKEGAAFDLGAFHDAFLREGAVPIRLIRRAMLGADGPLL